MKHWRSTKNNRADCKFISALLERVEDKHLFTNSYHYTWLYAYEQEPLEQKKENAGWRNANNNIRNEVINYMETGEKPELPEPPIVCGNCEFLSIDNFCFKFKQTVPPEYISKENNCEHYKNGIPF